MEKASEKASNYQSSLLLTISLITNQTQRGLGWLHSCRNSQGILHSYINGSKSFLWLRFQNNFKGALTAASQQRRVSACRRVNYLLLLIWPVDCKLTGSSSTGTSTKTGHKTIPRDNLPKSLQTPTLVRFVWLLLSLPKLPSRNLDIPAAVQHTFLKMLSKAVSPVGSLPGCSS